MGAPEVERFVDLLAASEGENSLTAAFFGRLYHAQDREPLNRVLDALFGSYYSKDALTDMACFTWPHWNAFGRWGLLGGRDSASHRRDTFIGTAYFTPSESELVHYLTNSELDVVFSQPGKLFVIEVKRGISPAEVPADVRRQVLQIILSMRLYEHLCRLLDSVQVVSRFAALGVGGQLREVKLDPDELRVEHLSRSKSCLSRGDAHRLLRDCLPDLMDEAARPSWFRPEKVVATSWSSVLSLVETCGDPYLERVATLVREHRQRRGSARGI